MGITILKARRAWGVWKVMAAAIGLISNHNQIIRFMNDELRIMNNGKIQQFEQLYEMTTIVHKLLSALIKSSKLRIKEKKL